ncbi:hypothetical protein SEA_BIANCATRI92_41 [Mycobacterium phage BiancaTri92]|nr:hypothetical protein SEA_LEOGANIA_41 [Mycobacterium phage Leogania]QGJ90941.1 hypothetical protein SEA_BIANCATRI92_41 [Mycobacterium phage BiancaTri92]
MSEIPLAPVILASVTNATPDGSTVLKLETRLTPRQVENIDQINQVVDLMREAMEEILQ